MRKINLFTIIFLFVLKALGQGEYLVKFNPTPLVLDGKLDESVWQKLEYLSGFSQYFPKDNQKVQYDTEIKMFFDDKNIYIGAKMYSKGNKYITNSLRRDFRAGSSDNITFIFDTFSDNTNAFIFGANPYGVLREGLLFNGASDNSFMNIYWDNKWKGECRIEENAWYCEAIIPFSTIRYTPGTTSWLFKSYRFDTQSNETSTIIQIPQSQIIMNLGYSIPIKFEKPLRKVGSNIAMIPYVSSRVFEDFESKNPNEGFAARTGLDAKIGVTAGLNLDLTVNPDFSNVEADRQVVNLTRFDINLPEQRQFFLENSDLFTGFGSLLTNPFLPSTGTLAIGNQLYSPFFSRNIGIGRDAATGLSVQNRINYGVRLSGKLSDTWRVGVLNSQTAQDSTSQIPGVNFTVLSLQKKIQDRSNIAAIFVNRHQNSLDDILEKRSNQVAGLEYNLQSKDNHWVGKVFYHRSFDSESDNQKAFAHGVVLNYNTRNFIAKWSHDWLGEGFKATGGFVPRENFFHINPTFGWNFYKNTKHINRYSVGVALDQYNSKGIGLTDLKAGPFLLVVFQNTTRLLTTLSQNRTFLFKDFDVLRSNNKLPFLPKDTRYQYITLDANLVTDLRKKVAWIFNPLIGQYYDGHIFSFSGTMNLRFQPYALVAFNYSYNNIKVSKGSNQVFVIGPNVDLTMTRNLYWTNYLQYNSQINNFNVNSRLQWRFAPVSDLFLVYTDNYSTELWMPKNRAIFIKMTYWLSL